MLALSIALPFGFALLGLLAAGIRGAAAAAGVASQRHALASLVERFDAEAHGAAAIFTPATDVLGQPACNANGICSELDFFTRNAQGVARFWAYRYDPSSLSLTRYAYDDLNAGSPVNLRSSGVSVSNVTSFGAQRLPISQVSIPALGAYPAQDVVVPLGYPGVAGGNALVAVDVANAALHLRHELAPRLTATGFSVVVGTYAPAAATPAPTAAPAPGQTRYYALQTTIRYGSCVGSVHNIGGGCIDPDPTINLTPTGQIVLGAVVGTLIAPLDSQIPVTDVCQTSNGSNAYVEPLVAMVDANGNTYAQVTDIKAGLSELWLVANGGSAYVAPAQPVSAPGPGIPNPFPSGTTSSHDSTEYVVSC
jgi:hypothetical protein